MKYRKNKLIDTVVIIIFYKIFGMATLSLPNLFFINVRNAPIFAPSKKAKMYNIILLLVLVLLRIKIYYLAAPEDNWYSKQNKVNKINAVSDYIQIILSSFASFSILLLYVIRQKMFVNIVNRIFQADSILSALIKNTKLSAKFFSPFFIIYGLIFFITFTISNTIAQGEIQEYLFPLSDYMVAIFLLQYGFTIKSIQIRFKIINSELMNFLFKEKVIYTLNAQYKEILASEVLKHLRQMHSALCEIVKNVSKFYSPVLIVCYISELYTLTATTYFLLLIVTSQEINILLSISIVIWIILLFFPVYYLSMNVNNCSEEVSNKILFFLHRFNAF